MNFENVLDQTNLTGLMRGYVQTEAHYKCIYCGRQFERGIIYPSDTELMEAERAVATHVHEKHGGNFKALLNQERELTGLTELQVDLLTMIYDGYSDSEIARKSGGKAESTIRNHRFQLRKRTREAKVLVTLMSLLEAKTEKLKASAAEFYQFAGPLTVSDDRIIVTKGEAEKIKAKYLRPLDSPTEDRKSASESKLRLLRWPKKQKEKLVVLDAIVRGFESNREYTEQEVNSTLSEVYADYVMLRRYLVDYGLFVRQPGGGDYRRSVR